MKLLLTYTKLINKYMDGLKEANPLQFLRSLNQNITRCFAAISLERTHQGKEYLGLVRLLGKDPGNLLVVEEAIFFLL